MGLRISSRREALPPALVLLMILGNAGCACRCLGFSFFVFEMRALEMESLTTALNVRPRLDFLARSLLPKLSEDCKRDRGKSVRAEKKYIRCGDRVILWIPKFPDIR